MEDLEDWSSVLPVRSAAAAGAMAAVMVVLAVVMVVMAVVIVAMTVVMVAMAVVMVVIGCRHGGHGCCYCSHGCGYGGHGCRHGGHGCRHGGHGCRHGGHRHRYDDSPASETRCPVADDDAPVHEGKADQRQNKADDLVENVSVHQRVHGVGTDLRAVHFRLAGSVVTNYLVFEISAEKKTTNQRRNCIRGRRLPDSINEFNSAISVTSIFFFTFSPASEFGPDPKGSTHSLGTNGKAKS